MSNFFNGGSGQSNPFSSGGSTANTIPKESSIAGQLVDSSLVDDGAGNVTIPGKIANTGQIVISQLATPSAPTLVITGGVGTSYSYKVVAKVGTAVTAASAAGSTVVGPTTLDGTHFIDVNWTAVVGATSYDIYRTVGGAAQGKIGNVLAPLLTLRDNALVGDASTAPVVNTTGGLTSASLTETPGTGLASSGPITLPDTAGSGVPSLKGATATAGVYFNGANVGLVSTTNGWIGVNSTAAAALQLPVTGILGWSSSGSIAAAGNDTFVGRDAARIVRIGNAALASPVANTLQVGESSRAATDSNVAGSAGTIRPGTGTGNGAGTKLVFQRNLMGASGTAAQSVVDAIVAGESKTLSNTSATATSLANISVPSNSGGGCWGCITIVATDGTNFDSETQSFAVSYVNKATVLTIGTPAITASTAASNSGSTTIGITVTAGTNSVDIKVTPVFTTIVPTIVTAYVELLNHGTGNVTIN